MLQNDINIQDYLLAKIDSLILHKLILKYPIKNILSLIEALRFIANLDGNISTRELHKKLAQNGNKISLITLNEYINYFLEEKIITKIPRYEIKTDKIVSNKVQYYFLDTVFRDTITNFQLNNTSRIKNNIYSKNNIIGNIIFTGKNRSFEFDFIIQSQKSGVFFIEVFKGSSKYELKKIINKMIKIHSIPSENSILKKEYNKYIVVESFEKLGIQKRRYKDVEIIEAEKFLEIK